jgi:hypothetical protein
MGIGPLTLPALRGWAPPSPALRERVPRAARRVRAGSRNFFYRAPLTSCDAQPEGPPAPPIVDRCRAANVVGAAGSAPDAIQVSPATSDRRLYRRLRLHPACAGNRARRRPTRGQCSGCPSDCLARKPRLARNPVLEPRCFNQYRRSGRSYPARASRAINPHPPSASRRAPPSPAVRERGSPLIPHSPSPAPRERVPSAARRVRVPPR